MQGIYAGDQFMKNQYDQAAQKKISKTMDEWKKGKLKSGTSGKKVTSRKQAVAIGISEARREGDRVPKRKSSH
jgi:hypothetical protein